jgi:hypothetical protein
MLMFFEGVLCNNRLNSLKQLREMIREPYDVMIYRDKKWVLTHSLTHLLTYLLTYSLTHSLTLSLLLTHSYRFNLKAVK